MLVKLKFIQIDDTRNAIAQLIVPPDPNLKTVIGNLTRVDATKQSKSISSSLQQSSEA